jgi:hypothetical protein
VMGMLEYWSEPLLWLGKESAKGRLGLFPFHSFLVHHLFNIILYFLLFNLLLFYKFSLKE